MSFGKIILILPLWGGLALSFAGVQRTTVDIDFVILLEQSDIVDGIMRKYGYETLQKTEDVANYSSDFAEFGRVDFLFAHRKYALSMLKRAEYKDFLGFRVKVISPEDLIGLKVQSSSNDPARYHKDMADIEEIVRRNAASLDIARVREYFKLFNREKELDEILEGIG